MKRQVNQKKTIQLVASEVSIIIRCALPESMLNELNRYRDKDGLEAANKWFNKFSQNVVDFITSSELIKTSDVKDYHNILAEFASDAVGITHSMRYNEWDLYIYIGNKDSSYGWEGIPFTCFRDDYEKFCHGDMTEAKFLGNIVAPQVYRAIELPEEILPCSFRCLCKHHHLEEGEVEQYEDPEEE